MINPESLTGYILTGEFGLLTMAPAYLLGILLPLVFIFHMVQGCLAESGLLALISGKLEKPFSRLGLSHQSLIPMLFGFSCTTAALAALSSMESKRERLICSCLLCVTIPCSAQNVVMIYFFLLLDSKYIFFYLIFIFTAFLLLGKMLNALLPKDNCNPLNLKPQQIKLPNFKHIFNTSVKCSFSFLKENTMPFLIGSLVVSFLTWFNIFAWLCQMFSPFTAGFLKLPEEASSLFILSIIKRDLGAAGLLSIINNNSFTQVEITICLIILTLFVPCFASVAVLFKQEKPPAALIIWLGSFLISMSAGKLASILLL